MEQKLFVLGNNDAEEIESKGFLFEHSMQSVLIENQSIFDKGDGFTPEVIGWEITFNGRGNRGRIDVAVKYTKDKEPEHIAICELKNVTATKKNGLNQLNRYLKNQAYCKNNEIQKSADLKGIIIAPDIDSEVIDEIRKSNNLYGIEVHRFMLNGLPYVTTTLFYPMSDKSHNKYSFIGKSGVQDDKEFSARQVVRRYIEEYIKDHKEITIEDLQKQFGMRGAYDMVLPKSEADNKDRRYIKEPIELDNGDLIRVCGEWTAELLDKFSMDNHDYKIIHC